MSIKTQWRRYAFAAALGLAASTQASAHVITAVTNQNGFTFVAAGLVPIPGMSSALFANGVNQRFVVTFSAECAVNAPAGNTNAWTDIDIQVRTAGGALVTTLRPTLGANDAFCAANGTAAFDGRESNSLTAVSTLLPAGVYRIVVMARRNGGATAGFFGDKTLVVSR